MELTPVQSAYISRNFGKFERISATVYFGDLGTTPAMHSGDTTLARIHKEYGVELIEEIINSTNTETPADINKPKPWNAQAGELWRVTGFLAFCDDDHEFLNLEWEQV